MYKRLSLIWSAALLLLINVWPKTSYADSQKMLWLKKSPPSQYIKSMATTPLGLLAGEIDSRMWLNPYNGVFISKDYGESWARFGLGSRGVTDIVFVSNTIYVTTYYVVSNTVGLFYSTDFGETWKHPSELNFSTNAVAVYKNMILIGGANHGLWVSVDKGETWSQKIGTGYYGPEVYDIKVSDNVFILGASDGVYRSTDKGGTWTKIDFLASKAISRFEIYDNYIIAGSKTLAGIFRSADYGQTWEPVAGFTASSSGGIKYFDGAFYIGLKNPVLNKYSVYKSSDYGKTWHDTELYSYGSSTNPYDIEWVFAQKPYIFAATNYDGIYRAETVPNQPPISPFLSIPWNYTSESDLLDKVTSYFDHAYPFLGYTASQEPAERKDKTLNFWGQEAKIPQLYYSTHDGYDFALPNGTTVTAAAAGYASYTYCTACGHTIKIDHGNGYQSVYMHLQKDGLITQSQTQPVPVTPGTALGKVGMTGNTSGPHLHFTINKDLNSNQNFSDDYPQGKTDPFGWQSVKTLDPWANYYWTDSYGDHQSEPSMYLWQLPLKTLALLTQPPAEHELKLDNKSLTIFEHTFTYPILVYLKAGSKPQPAPIQNKLLYFPNTAFLVTGYDFQMTELTDVLTPFKIAVTLEDQDVTKVLPNSIKLYTFNMLTALWEPITSQDFDPETNTLSATTHTFAQIAVFGDKADSTPPVTTLTIKGEQDAGWFTTYPKVSFTVVDSDPDTKTFFRLNQEIDWTEYTSEVDLPAEGVYGIEYKSVDSTNNWETQKDYLFKIDVQGRSKDTLTIIQASFTT